MGSAMCLNVVAAWKAARRWRVKESDASRVVRGWVVKALINQTVILNQGEPAGQESSEHVCSF